MRNIARSRRSFLFSSAALYASPFSAMAAVCQGWQSTSGFWTRPRELFLTRPGMASPTRILYYENERLIADGYRAACSLLCDAQSGVVTHMDLGLLNLLYAIQGVLERESICKPLIVTSAYRTEETNARTEGAVFASYHTQGRAADIRVDGVDCDKLFKLAASFGAGGVGYYPDRKFIHIDNGRQRYWQG